MPVETMAYASMMGRMLRSWRQRVIDGDIEDLADLIAFRDQIDTEIAEAIRAGRVINPWSWTDIARATGTTRQAAQQRWGNRGGVRGP